MLVRHIMHPNVYCATEEMLAKDLYVEFLASGIAGAPVLDSRDNLVGVVTLTDLARYVAGSKGVHYHDYYGSSFEDTGESDDTQEDDDNEGNRVDVQQEEASSPGSDFEGTVTVKDIMSPRIHQVHFDSTVVDALDLMLGEDIHRVVVTHKGHVIGIVTSGDMMREFRKVLKGGDEDE